MSHETQHHQRIEQQVTADLDSIALRQPVVADYVAEPYGLPPTGEVDVVSSPHLSTDPNSQIKYERSVDRRWNIVTEAARRAILEDEGIREAALDVASAALSERLPQQAVDMLSGTSRGTALAVKTGGQTLSGRLGLEPVPDRLMQPDISNAPLMLSRENIATDLSINMEYTPNLYADRLQWFRQRAEQSGGVTRAERSLVAQRYRYGRDVKMLGLMAELRNNPVLDTESVADSDGVVRGELPSGAKLVMTSEALADNPALLSTETWKSRKQLKDRVFVVEAGGRQYIQKERKTSRHTDTMSKGHRESLTSEQEFDAARALQSQGAIKQGDVTLHWEKPVAYVEFADGYQFSLYEKEEELSPDGAPLYELARMIKDSPESYAKEFADMQLRAKQLFQDREDLIPANLRSSAPQLEYQPAPKPKRIRLPRFGRNREAVSTEPVQPIDELTYDEFADAKAQTMLKQVDGMLEQLPLRAGYVNEDHNGNSVRAVMRNGRAELDVVGFDFEYYKHDAREAASKLDGIRYEYESGIRTQQQYSIGMTRGIKMAAMLAMREDIGMKLPPRPLTEADMMGAWG